MKTALVTGASGAIGAACARALAGAGIRVFLHCFKGKKPAEALAEELSAPLFCADLRRPEEVSRMFQNAGEIDILVNCAGRSSFSLFTDISDEEWDDIFAVNVKSVFLCCRAALPTMIRKKSGRIINISSIWGITGASCEAHYSAAKAAVIGLTKALAKEVGPSGIQINCVAPGVIDTPMNASLSEAELSALADATPLGRIGTPEEVARLVLFLCGGGGDFITGQVISPNGGFVI